MKDNLVNFVFKCHEKQSADLKIRLRFDGLQQTEFFCSLLEYYLDREPLMIEIVDKIKEKKMSHKKMKKSKFDTTKGKTLLADLGISDQEKNYIFDMIESEVSTDEE